MLTFIIRRLCFLVFVLFLINILIFGILMSFSPQRRAAAFATSPQQEKDLDKLVVALGLTDPWYQQYGRWLREILHGNFGWSVVAGTSVVDGFKNFLPPTMELVLFSAPLIILSGIWLGTLAGVHRDTWIDHTTRILSIVGWSFPTFLFALILMMIFYGYFKIFPPGVLGPEASMYIVDHAATFRRYTGMYSIDGLLNGKLWITVDALYHLVLPVFSEVIVVFALLIRVMRSGMIEALSQDYIITAKAKGANQQTIHLKHARRNAMIPVITISGLLIAGLITGTISAEVVFNRQGLGSWLANAATQLDAPVVLAVCLFLGVIFVVTNLIVDILYAYIDPRIRLS